MKFIKHLSLYTFISFFSAGINFFLMPYLSHFLTPADYGIIALVNSFVTILIPLIGVVAAGLIVVEYYKMKDKTEFASLFSSIQIIPIILSIVYLVCTIPFYSSIGSFFELPEKKYYWIPICILLAALSIYYETLLSYNVIEKKVWHFAFFNILKILLEVGLTIYFVSYLSMGWEGRLISWLISSLILFACALWYFQRLNLLTLKIRKTFILAAIGFGLPLILHTIGKFIINQSDRLFIAKMVSVEESGIYNVGYQMGMLMLLLVNAAGNFFQPYLYERLNLGTVEAKQQIVRMTYVIICIFLGALIVITIGSPIFFKYMVDKSYIGGTAYVFWVSLGYFFWGIYILFAGNIFYFNRTKILGYAAILNVLLNLILNYYLIKIFGALGAAYATCISFLVVSLMVIYFVSKIVQLPWFNLKILIKKNVEIL
jgi:O-antigen/teichoic acid export membrane protein